MGIENPIHLIFLAGVALLVLGPKRLPEVARTLGKGLREFREAVGGDGSVGGFLHHHLDAGAGSAPAAAATAPPSQVEPADTPAPTPPVGEEIQEADVVSVAAPAPDAAAPQVDPPEPVRSGDAPDRRPL